MKVITFILIMLISALAMMPCSDSITCEKENTSIHSTDSSPIAHDHSEDEGDLCTPFCNCACCGCMGFIITVPSVSVLSLPKVMVPNLTSAYQSNFISSYFYSFWQPPKVSIS